MKSKLSEDELIALCKLYLSKIVGTEFQILTLFNSNDVITPYSAQKVLPLSYAGIAKSCRELEASGLLLSNPTFSKSGQKKIEYKLTNLGNFVLQHIEISDDPEEFENIDDNTN